MTIHPVTFFLFSFVSFVLVASPVQAYVGKDKIPLLESKVQMSKEDFESKTMLVKEFPLQNKDLLFNVRLPKSWIKLDVSTENQNLGADLYRQLSAYTSPPRIEHSSFFRVKSIDLTEMIPVDDWFIGYMLEMGFSAEGMRVLSSHKLSAQYTLFENSEPYITRAIVTLTGSKIILAEYLVHQDNYAAERDAQILAMDGFDLLEPNEKSSIKMRTYSFADIAKFEYPENWMVHTFGITQINRMDSSVLRAINTRNVSRNGVEITELQMTGRVDVSVVSKTLNTTVAQEIDLLKKDLNKRHYKLGKFVETIHSIKLNPLITSGRIDVYEMESDIQKLAGYEYWVAVLQTDARYYLVRLITVSRGEDFVTWAENTETYRVLLGSLSPASQKSSY